MTFHVRRPSAATIIATTALCIAVGGGTAFAAASGGGTVHTKDIADGAVTNPKIADGAIGPNKLGPAAIKSLQGERGPRGPQGPAGMATTPVTSLGTTWVDHSDGAGGTSAIDANGAELSGVASDSGYAGISTDVLNGMTPAELSTISYTESYTQSPDTNRVAPYFKLKLQPEGGSCGDDDVVYNPSVQSDNLDYSGQTETYDVTAPYSTVGVDNDANPVDGAYPVALHAASNGAGGDVSNEPICLAEIILDGSSGATSSTTATVYNVTFAGAGLPEVTYSFGS